MVVGGHVVTDGEDDVNCESHTRARRPAEVAQWADCVTL